MGVRGSAQAGSVGQTQAVVPRAHVRDDAAAYAQAQADTFMFDTFVFTCAEGVCLKARAARRRCHFRLLRESSCPRFTYIFTRVTMPMCRSPDSAAMPRKTIQQKAIIRSAALF